VRRIYLINIGANTSHVGKARAPLFPDGRFVFVSFPDQDCANPYGREAWPFVRDPECLRTHADPDWQNLTYGDNCHNRRAKALLSVEPQDILLFWALFWQVHPGTDIFRIEHSERRWCILGSLLVTHVIKALKGRDVGIDEYVKDKSILDRAMRNTHLHDGKLRSITPDRYDVLFIGDAERSALFNRAVDLEIYQDSGLLQKTMLSKDRRCLQWARSPRWSSSLRCCRPVIDLSIEEDKRRAEQLRAAILQVNPTVDIRF
jgi:Nucleotide modification associated domain 3